MDRRAKSMRTRIALATFGLALLALAGVAQAEYVALTGGLRANDRAPYEQRYLRTHDRYAKEFGVREAGRNLVRDGFRERDGDVREAREPEVTESTERMRAALNPAPVTGPEVAAASTTSTYGAPTSVIECESGGDYGAVNPAGYYGAYQFDQQTWDAYAPEGYQGVNPASAPPSVQDAAAASVPYDAWPNC